MILVYKTKITSNKINFFFQLFCRSSSNGNGSMTVTETQINSIVQNAEPNNTNIVVQAPVPANDLQGQELVPYGTLEIPAPLPNYWPFQLNHPMNGGGQPIVLPVQELNVVPFQGNHPMNGGGQPIVPEVQELNIVPFQGNHPMNGGGQPIVPEVQELNVVPFQGNHPMNGGGQEVVPQVQELNVALFPGTPNVIGERMLDPYGFLRESVFNDRTPEAVEGYYNVDFARVDDVAPVFEHMDNTLQYIRGLNGIQGNGIFLDGDQLALINEVHNLLNAGLRSINYHRLFENTGGVRFNPIDFPDIAATLFGDVFIFMDLESLGRLIVTLTSSAAAQMPLGVQLYAVLLLLPVLRAVTTIDIFAHISSPRIILQNVLILLRQCRGIRLGRNQMANIPPVLPVDMGLGRDPIIGIPAPIPYQNIMARLFNQEGFNFYGALNGILPGFRGLRYLPHIGVGLIAVSGSLLYVYFPGFFLPNLGSVIPSIGSGSGSGSSAPLDIGTNVPNWDDFVRFLGRYLFTPNPNNSNLWTNFPEWENFVRFLGRLFGFGDRPRFP